MSPRDSKGFKVWVEPSKDRWRCRWRGEGKAGQQTFLYKADADLLCEKKRRAHERAAAGLPPIQTASGDYPGFRSSYERWLKSRRSSRTLYLSGRALDLYEEFGGKRFPDRPGVRDWSDWLLERQRPNGARITLRHAKAAFRWAFKEGVIDYDPFQFFEFPAAEKVARVLKPDELKAIFAELPEHVLRPVFFVLYTGLRLSEVAWLDWSGIERRGSKWYMTVRKSKTRRTIGEETKTQALHASAISVLGQPKESGSVFGLSKFTISENFREAVKRAGIGRVRLHDLRHTWATYLGHGNDIRALMQVGGWVTMQAAMIYQHETAERLEVTRTLRLPAPIRPLLRPSLKSQKKGLKTGSPSRK